MFGLALRRARDPEQTRAPRPVSLHDARRRLGPLVRLFGALTILNAAGLCVAALLWFQVPEPSYWGEDPTARLHRMTPLAEGHVARLQRHRRDAAASSPASSSPATRVMSVRRTGRASSSARAAARSLNPSHGTKRRSPSRGR